MAGAEARPRVSGRGKRATPDLLKKLRHLRVAVFHPKDADASCWPGSCTASVARR